MITKAMNIHHYLKWLCVGLLTAFAAFFFYSACYMPGGIHAEEAAAGGTDTTVTTTAFSCSATDANGYRFGIYQNPADGIWYLFLPSGTNFSAVSLNYTGNITEVSSGTLSPDTHTLSGCFAKNGDSVTLHLPETEIRIKAMCSTLPALQISLKDTTLAKIHQDKNVKYSGNSLILSDQNGNVQLSSGGIEMKGRGNSSWNLYEKKGYQIKFNDKVGVLGMSPAKKWILLPNSSDDSMIRNMLGMDLSKRLDMAYTPSFQYIDLWIDGDYRGTYLIGEKIEVSGSRVSLKNEKGILMEQDSIFYASEEHWFYDSLSDKYFTVKEAVNEDDKAVLQSSINEFHSALDGLMQYLYSTPPEEVTLKALSSMIDVDSFAKYYLINEYTTNREANHSSQYWYKDGAGDVLHMGPVWDFDTCMGNDGPSYRESYSVVANPIFNRLLATPAFYNRTVALKKNYSAAFSGMTGRADAYAKQISASAEMNYIRWNVLGQPNPKGGTDFHTSYQAAVNEVKNWLSGRSSAFQVIKPCLTTQLSADGGTITITARPGKAYPSLSFGVWSAKDEQNDLKWYPAQRQADGSYTATISLSEFQNKGVFKVHLYSNTGAEGSVGSYVSGTFFYR